MFGNSSGPGRGRGHSPAAKSFGHVGLSLASTQQTNLSSTSMVTPRSPAAKIDIVPAGVANVGPGSSSATISSGLAGSANSRNASSSSSTTSVARLASFTNNFNSLSAARGSPRRPDRVQNHRRRPSHVQDQRDPKNRGPIQKSGHTMSQAEQADELRKYLRNWFEEANGQLRPEGHGLSQFNRFKDCLIVTKTATNAQGFCEWQSANDHDMKFDLHVQNPAIIFKAGRNTESVLALESTHFHAHFDKDNKYIDIPRCDLSRALLSPEAIKQIFATVLGMSDMPEKHIQKVLQFVERQKKETDNWKPTLVVFAVELHENNPFPAADLAMCKYLDDKRPSMAVIRNISRVTECVDDFWHECMNLALDGRGPDAAVGTNGPESKGTGIGTATHSWW